MAKRKLKANDQEIMEAKWAINGIAHGDDLQFFTVEDVLSFMDVLPRPGAEEDAVRTGAIVYEMSTGVPVRIRKTRKRKNPMAKERNPAKNCAKNERFVTFSDGREVCFPGRKKRKAKKKSAKKRTVRRATRTTKITYAAKKKKRTAKSKKRAPAKPVSVPKGKRKGDHFTKNGKHYTVVSYIRDGKRVRFARRIGGRSCPVKRRR